VIVTLAGILIGIMVVALLIHFLPWGGDGCLFCFSNWLDPGLRGNWPVGVTCRGDCLRRTGPQLANARSPFPPPWSVEELDARFVVRDHNGQQLAYVYFEDEPGRQSAAKSLSKDEAGRIAAIFSRGAMVRAYGW